MLQDGQSVATATAITAKRRQTWSSDEQTPPAGPPPSEVATFESAGLLAWLGCYEMKPIKGAMPTRWDGLGQDSLSQLWVRDKPARRLDFAALSALADVFFPRIFLRRAKRVPAGTVSMTVYFHADASQLEEVGAGYLLAQASAQAFRHGFFDQTAQLWSEDGALLVTTQQVVYFKE